MLSVEARLAFAPEAVYRQLINQERSFSGWQLSIRLLVVVLVLAVMLPLMALHMITATLLFRSAVISASVMLIQVGIGAVVIGPAARHRCGLLRALDLWFAGSVPYSLWLLLLPAFIAIPVGTPHETMILSIAVPLVWTSIIVAAFCRVVLGDSPSKARMRAVLHLLLVGASGVAVAMWAAGGPIAILSYVVRRVGAL